MEEHRFFRKGTEKRQGGAVAVCERTARMQSCAWGRMMNQFRAPVEGLKTDLVRAHCSGFNTFINDLYGAQCTFRGLLITQLEGMVDMPDGHAASQRDLSRPEK